MINAIAHQLLNVFSGFEDEREEIIKPDCRWNVACYAMTTLMFFLSFERSCLNDARHRVKRAAFQVYLRLAALLLSSEKFTRALDTSRSSWRRKFLHDKQ